MTRKALSRIAAGLMLLWSSLPATAQVPVLDQAYELYLSGDFGMATAQLDAFKDSLTPREPAYPNLMARAYWQEAQIFAAQGQFQEARARADASIRMAGQAPAQAELLAAIYQGERGKILVKMGFIEQAHTDLHHARTTLTDLTNLASVKLDMQRYEAMMLSELGDVAGAQALFSELVEDWRARNNDTARATALMDLAGAKLRDGTQGLENAAAAETLVAEAKTLIPAGDTHAVADAQVLSGRIALQLSDLVKAERLFAQAAAQSDDPARRAHALLLQAQVHLLRGEAVRSERLYIDAIKGIRQHFGEYHPMLGRALVGLGLVNSDLGRPSEAISYLSQAVRVFEDGVGIGTVAAAEARVELAMIFNQVGEYTNASSVAGAALETLAGGQSDLRRAYAQSAFAFSLAGLGRAEDAIHHFETALDGIERLSGADSLDLTPGLIRLAALKGNGRLAEAQVHLHDALRILDQQAATGPRLTSAARDVEMGLLLHAGQTQTAATPRARRDRLTQDRYSSIGHQMRSSAHGNEDTSPAFDKGYGHFGHNGAGRPKPDCRTF